ncbi:MAG: prepilin-type N-terminal cleavage/methylation domain-containing protein [Nibricoccus sp.]
MNTRAFLSSRRMAVVALPRRALRRAFTLLEVLVALALVALVLVSMNTFVFSMGELWGKNTDLRLFELHVRNVTRFLEHELSTAALPPFASVTEQGITVQEIRAQTGMTDNYLTFELPEGSRIFTWPEHPLPDVVCALAVREREGLLLLWHSRLEKKFADDAPRETVITPLVTEMSYDYYETDFKNWKNERTLRKSPAGETVVPQRIRLKFVYSGREIYAVVGLPTAVQGVPML